MGASLNLLKRKRVVAESRETVALVLVILCLSSATVALTGVVAPASQYSPLSSGDASQDPAPETTHEVDQLTRIEAVVTGNTTAYANNQELVDEGVYPQDAIGDVTVTAAAEAREATITYHRLVLEYEATLGSEDSPFWTNTTVLTGQDVDNYTEGDTVTVQTSINTTAVRDRASDLKDDFGPSVSVQASFRVQTYYEYEDPARPKPVSNVANIGTNMNFRSNLLLLPTESDTTSVTTGGGGTASGNDDRSWINPLAALLFVVFGAGAVASLVYGGRLDPREIAFDIEQARHEEWVTVVDHFESSKPSTTTTVRDLGDLVDLAIDEHGRVVYSCTQERYIFVVDDVKYVYEPPILPPYADAFERSGDPESGDPLPEPGTEGDASDPGDDGDGTSEATTGLDLQPIPEDTDDEP